MLRALVITPEISSSTLRDGSEIFTASLKEMPSIVTEGESEQAAVSELIASMRYLREQLGVTAIGFHTTSVQSWHWVSVQGEETVADFGVDAGDNPLRAPVEEMAEA